MYCRGMTMGFRWALAKAGFARGELDSVRITLPIDMKKLGED